MPTPAQQAKTAAALCDTLAITVDALMRRRACDVPEATIDRFVSLRWLEWNGGTLRLTPVGEIVLMKAQATALAEAA